jgi:hypothetical protein
MADGGVPYESPKNGLLQPSTEIGSMISGLRLGERMEDGLHQDISELGVVLCH